MPQHPSSVNTNTALSCFLAAHVQEVREFFSLCTFDLMTPLHCVSFRYQEEQQLSSTTGQPTADLLVFSVCRSSGQDSLLIEIFLLSKVLLSSEPRQKYLSNTNPRTRQENPEYFLFL